MHSKIHKVGGLSASITLGQMELTPLMAVHGSSPNNSPQPVLISQGLHNIPTQQGTTLVPVQVEAYLVPVYAYNGKDQWIYNEQRVYDIVSEHNHDNFFIRIIKFVTGSH